MQTNPVELKTNLPKLTVLRLTTANIDAIQASLAEKSKTAPMMFAGLQVIVDLTALDSNIDVAQLKKTMLDNGINPLALMTDIASVKKAALENKVGWLPVLERAAIKNTISRSAEINKQHASESNDTQASNKSTKESNQTANKNPSESTDNLTNSHYEPKKTADENYDESNNVQHAVGSLVVNKQVRSGQRIYCQGDLTIIGSVSAGAEVIADGNIHIYGSLRGRALAGAKGDESGKIFCQDMQAELVSIAGQYTDFDELGDEYKGKALQISLENERINFFPL